MLFGIIRSWVSQITANSGIGPLLLPSIQFGQVMEDGEDESIIEQV
jgi:preprotein translocase subunit SecB